MDVIYLMDKEMLMRGYSQRTITTYNNCLRNFFGYYREDPKKISKKDVKNYLDYLIGRKASGSTLNVNLNALGFVVRNILNKNFMIKIKYSKVPNRMPTVLTQEEIIKLIDSIENRKHRLMIKLMYSAGLRVSELVNLKVENFEFESDFGWVRNGKGNKDRMFILANCLKQEIICFIKENNLNYDSYLFKSYNGHISTRTIQEILKKAAKIAKINKRVHPHALRHSYATHTIENGYDVASVQTLLGHNSAQTTMIYLHIAKMRMINVKSPLDKLALQDNSNINPNYELENFEERCHIIAK